MRATIQVIHKYKEGRANKCTIVGSVKVTPTCRDKLCSVEDTTGSFRKRLTVSHCQSRFYIHQLTKLTLDNEINQQKLTDDSGRSGSGLRKANQAVDDHF